MARFEYDICENLISQRKWQDATQYMRSTFQDINYTLSPSLEDIKNAIKYVKCELTNSAEQSLFLLELFRGLRNCCMSKQVQTFLSNNISFLNEIKKILHELIEKDKHKLITKVIFQLLVNLIVSNQEGSKKVHENLYDDILEYFLKKRNIYEVLALLYNLHLQNKDLPFKESMYENVLELIDEPDCFEYVQFLEELFLYDECFWNKYKQFSTTNRIVILELIDTLWMEKELTDIPEIALKTLSEKFSNSTDVIFQTVSESGALLEPYEVSLLLTILGRFCGNENYLKFLQEDKELIIKSGVVLLNVHRLGKQSENYFTAVQKLSEVREPTEAMQQHPAFGFKVGLVRLIGNLCWKNKKMQDLVRETEVIPVLLDCCNIDARNPLIMQWVILAVRNLCEDNLENQSIIAGLHKEGTVSSGLMEEMGLTLHDDESGGIRIVPLDLKK